MLTNLVEQSAKALGLAGDGIKIEPLKKGEEVDMSHVNEKLDEIKTKVAVLKESVEADQVVVKSWFESGE